MFVEAASRDLVSLPLLEVGVAVVSFLTVGPKCFMCYEGVLCLLRGYVSQDVRRTREQSAFPEVGLDKSRTLTKMHTQTCAASMAPTLVQSGLSPAHYSLIHSSYFIYCLDSELGRHIDSLFILLICVRITLKYFHLSYLQACFK